MLTVLRFNLTANRCQTTISASKDETNAEPVTVGQDIVYQIVVPNTGSHGTLRCY